MKTLVLGYGNRSRTDDGVGWFIIERLQEFALPNIELLTSHQLEVDHAEVISRFDAVIFVDVSSSHTFGATQWPITSRPPMCWHYPRRCTGLSRRECCSACVAKISTLA